MHTNSYTGPRLQSIKGIFGLFFERTLWLLHCKTSHVSEKIIADQVMQVKYIQRQMQTGTQLTALLHYIKSQ